MTMTSTVASLPSAVVLLLVLVLVCLLGQRHKLRVRSLEQQLQVGKRRWVAILDAHEQPLLDDTQLVHTW